MKQIYSPHPTETVSVYVESSPIWEIILGISGYTHQQLRHTFDLDDEWTLQKNTMSTTLLAHLQTITDTNFWYGLIMVQNKITVGCIQDFSNALRNMSDESLYELLLPYKDRACEPIRQRVYSPHLNKKLLEEYAIYFEDHEYLSSYIHCLASYPAEEIRTLFIEVVEEWYQWVSWQKEWKKWSQALSFQQKQHSELDATDPTKEIERITDGMVYVPEPSVWTIKLIPHISYRPWILHQRTNDTKLIFYPIDEQYLMEPGIPSNELIRGHKALGDELRLKILYQLMKGSQSLQDLSIQFNISKTTLHHQLSLLKAAKFISVDKGIYSIQHSQLNDFSERLTQYLGTTK